MSRLSRASTAHHLHLPNVSPLIVSDHTGKVIFPLTLAVPHSEERHGTGAAHNNPHANVPLSLLTISHGYATIFIAITCKLKTEIRSKPVYHPLVAVCNSVKAFHLSELYFPTRRTDM